MKSVFEVALRKKLHPSIRCTVVEAYGCRATVKAWLGRRKCEVTMIAAERDELVSEMVRSLQRKLLKSSGGK